MDVIYIIYIWLLNVTYIKWLPCLPNKSINKVSCVGGTINPNRFELIPKKKSTLYGPMVVNIAMEKKTFFIGSYRQIIHIWTIWPFSIAISIDRRRSHNSTLTKSCWDSTQKHGWWTEILIVDSDMLPFFVGYDPPESSINEDFQNCLRLMLVSHLSADFWKHQYSWARRLWRFCGERALCK